MCTVSDALWYPHYADRLVWLPLDAFMDGLVYYYTAVPDEDIHDININVDYNPVLDAYAVTCVVSADALLNEFPQISSLMEIHAGQIGLIGYYDEAGRLNLFCGCDYPDWADLDLGSPDFPQVIEEGIARFYPLLFNAELEAIDPDDDDAREVRRQGYESWFIYDAHREDIERAYGFDGDTPHTGFSEIYGCWANYQPGHVVLWTEDDVATFQASAFVDDEYDEEIAAG